MSRRTVSTSSCRDTRRLPSTWCGLVRPLATDAGSAGEADVPPPLGLVRALATRDLADVETSRDRLRVGSPKGPLGAGPLPRHESDLDEIVLWPPEEEEAESSEDSEEEDGPGPPL